VKAAQDGIQVIGLSALLTTTMSKMQTTIEALKTAGVRDRVKIIIGANAYAPDGSSATRMVREMLGCPGC